MGRSWLWDSAEGLKGPWHRFAGCHRWAAWARGADGSPRRRDRIDLLHDSERMRAYYGGLQTCGNSAVCPVCSGVIYDRRRAEVAATLDHARASGWRSLFITLTAAHTSETALEPFLDALGEAMSLVYEGSPWTRFRRSCGYIGSIKGLEITRGVHGWHPHYHLLWFCERGEVSEVQAYVDRAWASALERVGLSGLKGVRAVVKDSSMTADEYIAKFDRVRGWDLDAELTMWARKEGATQKGLTPWDFLRIGLAGDEGSAEVQQARALFCEYAVAIRGKHPLRFSGGLKARVGLADVKDEAIAAGEANQVGLGVMGHLSLAGFRRLLGHDCRGELLAVAGVGEVAAVVAFLGGLGIEFDMPVMVERGTDGTSEQAEGGARPGQPYSGDRGVRAEGVDVRGLHGEWRRAAGDDPSPGDRREENPLVHVGGRSALGRHSASTGTMAYRADLLGPPAHKRMVMCKRSISKIGPEAVSNSCGREARRSGVLNWPVRGETATLLSPESPLGVARAAPPTGKVKGTSEPLTLPERTDDRE